MRPLRRGDSGDDVRQLQHALKRLGLYFYVADGSFGYSLETAVTAFQRSSGLTIDGIAGPETLAALGLDKPTPGPTPTPTPAPAPTPPGSRRTISLHVGLNQVDSSKYGGWDGKLNGCENDARTMVRIAEAEGFDEVHTMFTRQATTGAVLQFINDVARRLNPGDLFLLTYAGHGGQLPNQSAQDDPEEDGFDETWVLWDEQLRDDLLWEAWANFRPGTNIVVCSDSCHSGSIARLYLPDYSARSSLSGERDYQEICAAAKKAFYTDLTFPRPGPNSYAIEYLPRPRQLTGHVVSEPAMAGAAGRSYDPSTERAGIKSYAYLARAYLESNQGTAARAYDGNGAVGGNDNYATREMPLDVNMADYMARRERYESQETPSSSRGALQANLLAISGCADMQLSQEINGAGVFTTTLNRVWANNTFAGSFIAFHRDILGQMTANQTPQLTQYGPSVAALTAATPFNR